MCRVMSSIPSTAETHCDGNRLTASCLLLPSSGITDTCSIKMKQGSVPQQTLTELSVRLTLTDAFFPQCIQSVYTSKIISSDRDLLAVVFYGTEKDKNSVNFKSIYVLQDLDNPGAKRVLELDRFKGQQGKKHFRDTIGHGSDYSLSEVLWVCANLFSDVQFKMSHKRIMLFTNEDDPHGNDSAKASRARTKASDLRDTGGHFPYLIIALKMSYSFYFFSLSFFFFSELGTEPRDSFYFVCMRVPVCIYVTVCIQEPVEVRRGILYLS